MGTVEPDKDRLILQAHIITYGHAADTAITEQIRDEIETMWNEPHGKVLLDGRQYIIEFRITAFFEPGIADIDIYRNLDPRNNYFRVEKFAVGNISFVDGIGCNSGYFMLENLYKGSTTAAHEFGHTLGLDHPMQLDIRGKGLPGIMYPRGTLVDPAYQYDSSKHAGETGGTMHPMYRKVLQADIEKLGFHKLSFRSGTVRLGEFTNKWHPDHAEIHPENIM